MPLVVWSVGPALLTLGVCVLPCYALSINCPCNVGAFLSSLVVATTRSFALGCSSCALFVLLAQFFLVSCLRSFPSCYKSTTLYYLQLSVFCRTDVPCTSGAFFLRVRQSRTQLVSPNNRRMLLTPVLTSQASSTNCPREQRTSFVS